MSEIETNTRSAEPIYQMSVENELNAFIFVSGGCNFTVEKRYFFGQKPKKTFNQSYP